MKVFPSWIDHAGRIYFVTDRDLDEHEIALMDGIGHDAIQKVFHRVKGKRRKGFPCPREIQEALADGRMNRMKRTALGEHDGRTILETEVAVSPEGSGPGRDS